MPTYDKYGKMIDSSVPGYAAKTRAYEGVKSFMRKINFDSFVRSGLSPTEAARRVGIRVPVGREISAQDLAKVLRKGKI